jgi:adenosine kinase
MRDARKIDLGAVLPIVDDVEIVVVTRDDPAAMSRHVECCVRNGVPFALAPAGLTGRIDGAVIRRLVEGATYLFTGEHEATLLHYRTGWSARDVLKRVRNWVRSERSQVSVTRERGATIRIDTPPTAVIDKSGAGDVFRAGFLAGRSRGLDLRNAGQLGAALAALATDATGAQGFGPPQEVLVDRIRRAYGRADAAVIESAIFWAAPARRAVDLASPQGARRLLRGESGGARM